MVEGAWAAARHATAARNLRPAPMPLHRPLSPPAPSPPLAAPARRRRNSLSDTAASGRNTAASGRNTASIMMSRAAMRPVRRASLPTTSPPLLAPSSGGERRTGGERRSTERGARGAGRIRAALPCLLPPPSPLRPREPRRGPKWPRLRADSYGMGSGKVGRGVTRTRPPVKISRAAGLPPFRTRGGSGSAARVVQGSRVVEGGEAGEEGRQVEGGSACMAADATA